MMAAWRGPKRRWGRLGRCGRRWVVAAAVLAGGGSGCASKSFMSNMATPGQASCPESVDLTVTPSSLQRGAAVSLDVLWIVAVFGDEVTGAQATLSCGANYSIEVDVPLSHDASQDTSSGLAYSGSVMNPFGSAAPAGTVSVLATGQAPSGCRVPPSAATTFELR